MNRPTKWAILVHHGLGDVAMALPGLLHAFDEAEGELSATLLVKSEVEAQLVHLVDWPCEVKTLSLDFDGGWKRTSLIRIASKLRKEKFDLLVAPHADCSLAASIFSRIVSAKHSIGPNGPHSWIGFDERVQLEDGEHKSKYYARFAPLLGERKSLPTSIPLRICLKGEQQVIESLQGLNPELPLVLLAPSSSPVELHKRWPVERWRDLVERILSKEPGVNIAVMGTANELQLLKMVAGHHIENKRLKVVILSSIEMGLCLMRRSTCLVSACTGPSHLAALSGISIVAIYGPTNFSFTGPFSNKVWVVGKGYKCSPCYRRKFTQGCGTPICMTDIEVEEVFAPIQAVLAGENAPTPTKQVTTTATTFCKTISEP